MFNAAVLRALDGGSIVERVHVLVAKSALESRPFEQVGSLGKVTVARALAERPLRQGRWREMRRTVGCYVQLDRIVRSSRSIVCIHLASDNLIGPLWLLLDRLVRGTRSYVILHNNAHGVKKSAAIRLLWGTVFRAGVRPVVLARTVYAFYTDVYPNVRFNFIPHPSYDDASGWQGDREMESDDQAFLFLGRHGMSSTTGFLREFIWACSAVRDGNPVTIMTERSMASQVTKIARSAGIQLRMYDWPLEHEDYYEMVRAARFVVFPPNAADRVSASGVHFDAISYCVPIIGPSQGVFRENVPDSGLSLLYEDAHLDLGRAVRRAVGMSPLEYGKLRSDVAEIRSRGDVTRTAQRFTHMLMESGQ
ncbi:MAG: hypothetical protein OXC31_03560 [Spirochaetaceae bacterium]|nr:hypothetical protein [Spirochaetaceae bacterium]